MKMRRGSNNNAGAVAAANAAVTGARSAPGRGRGLVRSNSMKMLRGGAAKANKMALAGLANNSDRPNSLSPPRRGLDEPEQPNKQPAASMAPSRPTSRRAMLARTNSMKLKPGHKQPLPKKEEPPKEEQPAALNPVQRRMMRRNSMKNLFPLDASTIPQIQANESAEVNRPLSLKMPKPVLGDTTEKAPAASLPVSKSEDAQNTEKEPTLALAAESD